MTDIRFLGHSCFELSDGDARVLIDPFLKPNNPSATVTGEEVDPNTILVTHGHVDHIGDTESSIVYLWPDGPVPITPTGQAALRPGDERSGVHLQALRRRDPTGPTWS